MRTTIDLPDELLRQVKARAALNGLKLKELITRYVEDGLRRARPLAETEVRAGQRRTPPPVIIPARGIPIPALMGDELREVETREDEARYGGSP